MAEPPFMITKGETNFVPWYPIFVGP